MKIALTGGIGSGKSFVCRLLEKRGLKVYDCDAAAKRLMRTSEDLKQQLCNLIGPEAYTPEGLLNKAEVARFLLLSEGNASAVDAIVHPAVARDFEQSGYAWMECAILYESGFDRLVDRVVAVCAPTEVRLQRIMARDAISRQRALEWLARQWPQEEVCRRADYVIDNDGRKDLDAQLDSLCKEWALTDSLAL